MRKLLILGAALIVAVPAIAQPGYDRRPAPDREVVYDEDVAYDEEYDEAAEPLALPHPGEVREIAGAMDRLIGAVMDLPIGGIARAMDPYGANSVPPGATVRDMATRDDPHAEARLRAGIHGATRGVGAMSEALARAMPVLQRSFEQVSRDLERAMDEVDTGRPY